MDADVDGAGGVRAGLLESDVAPHATPAPNRRETWKVRKEVGSDKYFISPPRLEKQGRLRLNLEQGDAQLKARFLAD